MDKNKAVEDFMQRIEHYRENYHSLDYSHDKDLSFIQIFNQGERFLVNKLAGNLIFLSGEHFFVCVIMDKIEWQKFFEG